MQVVHFPDHETHTRIEVIEEERPLNDDEFLELCAINPDLRIEREASGEIIIMPPTGSETGYRNSEVIAQLRNWARIDGRGRVFDSSSGFRLPNNAILSADAAWVLKDRMETYTKSQKKTFLPICPDFVIELTSPSDRLSRVQSKMREWIENGAQLGWLIDADRRTVYIYRPQQQPDEIVNPDHIDGEGPVAGFRLELSEIFQGL